MPQTEQKPPVQAEGSAGSQIERFKATQVESIEIPLDITVSPDITNSASQSKTTNTMTSAVESMNKGDYGNAIELFKEAMSTDKRAVLGIGIAYFRAGDHDKAINYLEESLNYNETFEARKLLAFIYYKKDNPQKSLSNAEKGLLAKPDPELQTLYETALKETSTHGKYLEESVLHFRVLFDGYEHGGISRQVLSILDDAYNSIGSELSYFPNEPITVILYTEKDFFDITRAPEWSGGIYDGKIKLPVKGIEQAKATLKQVLFHEYTHAVIQQIVKNCPVWLNEGLAEYFSGRSKKVKQVIPLKKLEGSFLKLTKSEIDIAYKESYSAVSYLIEQHGILDMKHLLFSLGEGANLNEAFMSAFYINYDEFVSTWGLP